jgi:hypothetical protein
MAPIPTFIERLERQRTEALATIDSVLQRATDEDRDLTETEESTLADARGRLERSDSQRGEWVELLEHRAAGDELGNRMSGAMARSGQAVSPLSPLGVPDPEAELQRLFRSPGEYVHTFVAARSGDPEAEARLQRVVANQTVPDNLGIVPIPILGPVVSLIANARPTVSSANRRALPAGGRSFTRPLVTQHTLSGVQSAEKTELASQKMLITPVTVNKATYGGTLDISFQDRDWTEPALLQIVIDDMATVYARQTDAGFCTAFSTAITATLAAASADGPGLQAAIAKATATVYSAVNLFPDTMWVSPDMWAAIAALHDTTGRALFATIGPMNATGRVDQTGFNGNVYGLQLVVDQFLPAGTIIVGVSQLAEFYEQVGGQLSVTEPSILGFVVAYYGYVAWCFPAPAGFVKITGVPPLPLDVSDEAEHKSANAK